jgi:hypothetical protein
VARLPQLIVPALCVAGMVLAAAAQEPSPTPKKKSGDGAETAEVRFADGSTVRMIPTQASVEITTRYGKLNVPIAEIRRIEFGTRYPDGVHAKIETAIANLTEKEAKVRQAAELELRGLRELAYPALKRAAVSSDVDRALQATILVKWMDTNIGAEKLKVRDLDVIHAAEFKVAGRIEATELKGRTSYFGEVTVKVAEVRTIRFVSGPGMETELVIDAAKYAGTTQDVWLDTEVDLGEGGTLEIYAAGQVDLWPQGGNYKTGPDAQPRMGTSPDGNPAGMLLGRIGERGKVFQIGSKYTGTVSESGRLYLRIGCSPWNNPSVGSYGVKINPNADSGFDAGAMPAIVPERKGEKLKKK